jgi:aspartate-semialdehyde dehydrogenase
MAALELRDDVGELDAFLAELLRDLEHALLSIFSAGDQLLKGAAFNAVQIAEELLA